MLYWLAPWLTQFWGPFRLLGSHLMLLSVGTLLSGLLVWKFLPRLWHLLPLDRGKTLTPDGKSSVNKPTGAGVLITLLLLPVLLLFAPLGQWEYGTVGFLYLSMLFGYLDDRSALPWGRIKKGLFDTLVSVGVAWCIYKSQGSLMWLPFSKQEFVVPLYLYLPLATVLLWCVMNATNCTDGVDGLAGSLTLLALFALAGLLYGVVGYRPIADYLLLPHNPDGARWAIVSAINAGALAGYVWHNAHPSRVLMGDAGSRFLGLLVGALVLASGNPVVVLVVAPVALVNGLAGLLKILLLQMLQKAGYDIRQPDVIPARATKKQLRLIRWMHKVTCPLHDHCRKKLGWSPTQVLVRFVLLQCFLTPLLFVIMMKVR